MVTTDSRSAQRAVLGITSAASFMVALDALVVSTALSAIRAGLHASLGQLEWTINAYLLSFAVLMMTAAALGDRLGRRRLFAVGLGLFALASAACALAPGIGWLIAARAVQGTGAALVMPLGVALLGTAFPPQQRGRAMGIYSSVTGLALACGPLLGGTVVQGISWRWIFWFNVPVAVALIPLALSRIRESFGPAAALDLPGLVLITGAAFGLVWGLVRGNSAGWGSAQVVSALAAGVLLTAAFALRELRAREPMLPLRMLRSRAFSAGNAAIFCWSASVLGTMFFMAQFLQDALGYGPLATGLRLMPWGATTFIVPRLAGQLAGRVGQRPLVAGGMLLQAGSMLWISLAAAPHLAYWQIVAPLTLSGAGFGAAIPAIQTAVLGAVAPPEVGKASGTMNTLRQLGGAFGIAVMAAVFAATGSYAPAAAFSHGFAVAIAVGGALALAGALAGLALPNRSPAPSPPLGRAAITNGAAVA
jgi:EmrB/QacA subfamily drug resistance transporter